jgi:hypothetical protein
MVMRLLSTETANELVSCVLGFEEIGSTRCVRSATDCNLPVVY